MICLVSSSVKCLFFCRRSFRSPPSQSSVTRYILWRMAHKHTLYVHFEFLISNEKPLSNTIPLRMQYYDWVHNSTAECALKERGVWNRIDVFALTFGVSKTSSRCIICSCFTFFMMLTSLSRCFTPEVPACMDTKHLWHLTHPWQP